MSVTRDVPQALMSKLNASKPENSCICMVYGGAIKVREESSNCNPPIPWLFVAYLLKACDLVDTPSPDWVSILESSVGFVGRITIVVGDGRD